MFNRKKAERTIDGKYKYIYPTANGLETIIVSESDYLLLFELDNAEYNAARRELRHRSELPAYKGNDDEYDSEETDPWENYPDKTTTYLYEDICERLDREAVIDKLSKRDKQIYFLCGEMEYTQAEAAEIMKLEQSTVSRRLKYIYDLLETDRLNDGTRTPEEIEFEKKWQELLRTGKTKNDDDILLDHIFTCLYPDDLWQFLHWYYSFGELCRYMLRSLLLRENYVDEDIAAFLNTAGRKGRKHFEEYYSDKPPLVQCVYVNLLNEAWRRVQISFHDPLCSAYDKLED